MALPHVLCIGSLIDRPVTRRTIARSRHPRTGITQPLLHLSTTTELVIVDLVPQRSTTGFRACERRPLSLSPNLSELISGGRIAATPDPDAPRVLLPHTTET